MTGPVTSILDHAEESTPRLAEWLKRRFVELAVPANRAMGIRIAEVEADTGRVTLRLKDRRRNHNVGGTTHGGVLLAFAETVHGVAVLWRFPPSRHGMVTTRAAMDYLAPARGELRTSFVLEPALQAAIDSDLTAQGHATRTFTSEVHDHQGTVVARLRADYRITRR